MDSFNIKALASLLNPRDDDSDGDELPSATNQTVHESVYRKIDIPPSEFDSFDTRQTPEWTVTYRQTLTPEDVHLQSAMTPATFSCQEMLVKIHLPGESRDVIDVNVSANEMEILSAKYKLKTGLPHAVDARVSRAQWDPEREMLMLTLKITYK